MNLTVFIESAELRFRQILEDFFVSSYDERNLHSHGINHHRRVWSYAKEILSLPLIQESSLSACDPEKLIIACYMHDIGMSADPGPRHGKISRELCQKFLINRNLELYVYQDLLETIENHDNKDYASCGHESSLLTVLSLADDLDAFGYTGIYRYCEIYLRRGISASELGKPIRQNALKRFENFAVRLAEEKDFVSKHRKRYEILDSFFRSYNRQAVAYNFLSINPKGYCGVIQLFILMEKRNLSLMDFIAEADRYNQDSIIARYLSGIQTELSDYPRNE